MPDRSLLEGTFAGLPWESQARGTNPGADPLRILLDKVAVHAPEDKSGYALVAWAVEVTKRLEAGDA